MYPPYSKGPYAPVNRGPFYQTAAIDYVDGRLLFKGHIDDFDDEDLDEAQRALNVPVHLQTQAQKKALWQVKHDYPNLIVPYWKRPEGAEVEGLCCLFNVVMTNGDRLQPGCFRDAKVKSTYWYYSHQEEYGRTADVKALYEVTRSQLPLETQKAFPQATGGLVAVRLYRTDPKTNGNEAFELLVNGTIKGLSVCYIPMKMHTTVRDGKTIRDVYEADLSEISDALKPACPGTIAILGSREFSKLEGRYKRWQ